MQELGNIERRYWESIYCPVIDENGQVNGLSVYATDITDRKQAEDNFLKNQYYLTKAQEIGIIGTWELDIQKNILIWTDEICKIFGVPLGTKLTYEIFLDCIHPEDRNYVHKKWNCAIDNEPYDIMHRIIVDDRVKWVRKKADIEFDTEGKAIIAIGFTQDLTGLKKIQDSLKESEKKYQTIMESMTEPLYISAQNFIIKYMNPSMVKRTGHDATGESCFKAIHDLDKKCPWWRHEDVQARERVN